MAAFLLIGAEALRAQQTAGAGDSPVTLNLPDEVELSLLVDLTASELGLRVFYDETLRSKRVSVRSPPEVPREALRSILESALRSKGCLLTPVEPEGWFRVIEAKELTRHSRPESDVQGEERRDAVAVTRLFPLEHASPQRVAETLKPFLSDATANTLPLEENRSLVVTDWTENMARLGQLVSLLDQPRRSVEVAYLPLEHLVAADAARDARQVLEAKRRAEGVTSPSSQIALLEESRTNRLVAAGTEAELTELREVLRSLDVPLGLETRTYRFSAASVKRVDELLRSLLGPVAAGRTYRAVADESAGILVVTATSEIHRQIDGLKEDFDLRVSEKVAVTRFYRIVHSTAAKVLATIREIQGTARDENLRGLEGPPAARQASYEGTRAPIAQENPAEESALAPQGPRDPQRSAALAPAPSRAQPPQAESIDTGKARVVADPTTNSIVVVAPPEEQLAYAELIEKLDRPRPQVLLEVTILTLDTTGSFSIGVEISRFNEGDDAQVLTFSSFGLSEVDPVTGALSLIPGLGFNGTVLSDDIAQVVIRALSTSGRARVLSAPKLLVSDNSQGTLNSVQDAPYTSVNASNTVATTSFGGFENAGTTIAVTPHLSEGDQLQLEYSVTLSTFSGQGSEGIPPPRQRDELQSTATIPDGHTIVVGGLTREDSSDTRTKVPILGDIPLLGYLFSSRSRNQSSSTLFVFLKPVILRDDKFRDLKYLSERDAGRASLSGDYPKSEPMVME